MGQDGNKKLLNKITPPKINKLFLTTFNIGNTALTWAAFKGTNEHDGASQ